MSIVLSTEVVETLVEYAKIGLESSSQLAVSHLDEKNIAIQLNAEHQRAEAQIFLAERELYKSSAKRSEGDFDSFSESKMNWIEESEAFQALTFPGQGFPLLWDPNLII